MSSSSPIGASPPRKSTPAQIVRVAERRRERKDEQRTPRQRSAAALVDELQRLANDPHYFEHRADLNKLILRVRLTAKRTPEQDAAAVVAAIARGAYTVDEITDPAETDLPKPRVMIILHALKEERVVTESIRFIDEETGQKQYLYNLTGKPLPASLPLS